MVSINRVLEPYPLERPRDHHVGYQREKRGKEQVQQQSVNHQVNILFSDIKRKGLVRPRPHLTLSRRPARV